MGIGAGSISSWIGGGATTTLGAVQTLYGLYKQKHNKRPEYQIPDEINQNLSSAKSYAAQSALEGLPEEQKQQYLSNIQRSEAYGLNQLSTRKAGLAGIASLNQNSNDAYGNLMAQDAGQRIQNQRYGQQLVAGANQNLADYKDKSFEFNKVNPYYENTARNNAMIGAGIQNVSQGLQSSNSGGNYGQQTQQQTPQVNQWNPQSGNQYYSPANNQMGMTNYNPYSQNGSITPDGIPNYNNYA